MKYICEVTSLLMQAAESRYEISKAALHKAQSDPSTPLDQLAQARSEHMRAAKDYLAIAFKTRFLATSTPNPDHKSVYDPTGSDIS